ncbi:MAG TPA: four helix bundle protein [Pyrinomonadaceae bacterium]|jgi:hypothetical protein
MKVKNYQKLIAWQRAMDLVEDVYNATKDFPREEIYALTSQIRRAAVSIPSNMLKVKEDAQLRTFYVICRLLMVRSEKLKLRRRLLGD